MAPTRTWIKRAVGAGLGFAALLLQAAGAPASAASFSPKRGINLDAWTTWPAEERWGDPAALFPFPEWRRTVGEAELARLKAAGFDFVRVPVDPAPFLSPVSAPLHDRLFEDVQAAVRFLNGNGLKAIVDFHLMPAGPGRSIGMGQVMDEPEMFDAYVELVRRMARMLSRFDATQAAFEPMNEPILDCAADGTNLWPERQKRLWAAARAAAPRLTLVLTGACYSGAEALEKLDPADFPDDNLLWTFHSYAPFVLTHQGATWAGDLAPFVSGLPFPLSSIPKAELEARLEAIREKIRSEAPWSRQAGLLSGVDELVGEIDTPEKLDRTIEEPFAVAADWAARHRVAPETVLLGEFGMIRQEYGSDFRTPAASRAAYVRMMASHAEAHGFAWSVWSYGGAFGLVEGFDREKAEPEVLDALKTLPPAPETLNLRPGID